MKQFLLRSIHGLFFGAFLTVIITIGIIYFGEHETLNGMTFIKNAVGYMICGWFFSTSSLIFEIKDIKLLIQTLLHFITVSILYFILSFLVGWFPFTIKATLLVLFSFVVVYALFWVSFYLYFKKKAKSLTADLKHL